MKDLRSVAPGENVFQLIPIRLCQVTLDSLPEFRQCPVEPKEDKRTWFEIAAEGLNVEIVKNAYVILLRVDSGDIELRATIEHGVFARTDNDGELVYICALPEVDDSKLKQSSQDPMLFTYMEDILCFWTQSEDCFSLVLEELKDNPDEAVLKYGFEMRRVCDNFTFTQRWNEDIQDNCFELLDSVPGGPPKLPLIREVLVGYAEGKQYAGYFPGDVVNWWLQGASPIFQAVVPEHASYWMVGSRAIYALYLAELVYYHALSLPQRYAADFAVFAQVKDVVEKSKSGERDPVVDEATRTFQIGIGPFEFGDSYGYGWWKEYRDYAYICARTRDPKKIDRELFDRAVDFYWSTTSPDWWLAAEEIKGLEPKAIHPCDHNLPRERWHTMKEKHALAIFDFYRFGLDYEENHWFKTIEATEERLKENTREIFTKIRDFLGKYVTKSALIAHMGFWYPDDPDRRGELLLRYLTISDQTQYDWSSDSDRDLKYESMLKEFAEWFGTLLKKVGEMIEHHYEKLEHVQKLAENLKNQEEEISLFFGRVANWDKRIGRYTDVQELSLADQQIHTIKLAWETVTKSEDGVAFTQRRIVVRTVKGEVERTAYKLQFLEDEVDDVYVDTRSLQTVTRTSVVRLETMLKLKKYEADPHLKGVKVWPKCLIAAGQLIGLAISSQKLVEEFKKDSNGEVGMALVRVGKEAFEVIEGSHSMYSALRISEIGLTVSSVASKMLVVKGLGSVLEVVINYHDAAHILFMDDSPALEAAAEGRETVARLQMMKGVVLFCGTTIGVGLAAGTIAAGGAAAAGAGVAAAEAGVGATLGLGLPPLGFALAVTACLVIVLDVGIYLVYGPSNIMDELRKELRKANEREFGVRLEKKADSKENPEFVPKKHRTIEDVDRFRKRIPALLV